MSSSPSSRDAQSQQFTDSYERRETLAFAHPLSIGDAIDVAGHVGIDVLGYRQGQPGVEGEFYPSADYSAEDYIREFSTYTGTSPAIVGLVVESAGET